jgi:DNA-binding CsgD family transcriptional regulator
MANEIEEITLRIYDTVADNALWGPVLDEFVERIGAQGSIIFEWEEFQDQKRLTAPLFSGLYTADALKKYLHKYEHLEARDQAIVREHTKDNDKIDFIDDTVLAKSVDDLKQQDHVKALRKLGIFHRAAGVLNKDNRWISLFSVQLNTARQPLNEEERQYMALLLPHFAKALDLGLPMRQLNHKNHGILAAIDRLTIGICILDSNGNIVIKNEEFLRQQDAYKAFRVTNGGALRMVNDQDQKRFGKYIADVNNHGKFGARPRKEAISTTLDNFLCIEITPLNKSEEMGSKVFEGFIVYSTDTSMPVRCNTSPIKHAFGLTDTELSLVDAIGDGLTNPEIAEHRGRSVSTINAQVKSILSKSQCATRTQFVRTMMRFGGSFLSPSE